MDVTCKRHLDLPSTSRLFADFLYQFPKVSRFYDHSPWRIESFAEAARMDYPDSRRQALVHALRAQNGDHPALERLARPGTVAVVTGQQVGLFSGPSYTAYKALSAVNLAATLSAKGIPAVPVFWLATEDHDLAEVSTCWTFDAEQNPVALHAEAVSDERPVGGIPLAQPPTQQLRDSLAGLPFADEVADLVARCYQPGATLGGAFAALVRALMPDLLLFDPMHPESRALAAPFLSQAVQAAPDLADQLLKRNQELGDAGYHGQVHFERHTSLFFLLREGRRLNLRRRNGEYTFQDGRITADELKDNACAISPNALLRPVTQDYMLPTVAYIGGPAELAYLAQAQVIYHTLLGRMPVAVSRSGFTLIDPRSAKLLKRFELTLDDFFQGEEHLRDRMANKLVPPELMHTFGEVNSHISANLDRLGAELLKYDPTLAAALNKSATKIRYQLSKTELKAAREAFRRHDRATADSHYLFNALYPHRHLQERFYTILPFLARHGLDLIDRLRDHVHTDCPDHHLAYL